MTNGSLLTYVNVCSLNFCEHFGSPSSKPIVGKSDESEIRIGASFEFTVCTADEAEFVCVVTI